MRDVAGESFEQVKQCANKAYALGLAGLSNRAANWIPLWPSMVKFLLVVMATRIRRAAQSASKPARNRICLSSQKLAGNPHLIQRELSRHNDDNHQQHHAHKSSTTPQHHPRTDLCTHHVGHRQRQTKQPQHLAL